MESETQMMIVVAAAAIASSIASHQGDRASAGVLALVSAGMLLWLASSAGVLPSLEREPSPDQRTMSAAQADAACRADSGSTCAPDLTCSLQSYENPWANPSIMDMGTPAMYGTNCSVDKAKALMKARNRIQMTETGSAHAFYTVPNLDRDAYQMWMHDMGPNCKSDTRYCEPGRPASLVRLAEVEGAGGAPEFAGYV